MGRRWPIILIIFQVVSVTPSPGQSGYIAESKEIDFVSDTQAPMRIEKVFLKSHLNTKATRAIFHDLIQRKPSAVFILGDVVALGSSPKKWKAMDHYLDTLRQKRIAVHALLGNHDVMGNARRGEVEFNKRFPDEVRTGYVVIQDSIAVILLNSNFKTLSADEQAIQRDFYKQTLQSLEASEAVQFIIVSCHHAPYTNSTVVSPSVPVQRDFVPLFLKTRKAKVFVTGHAHAFEHFKIHGKDFLTIGGGGGIHQPLRTGKDWMPTLSAGYTPEFHYLSLRRSAKKLLFTSYWLKDDFETVEAGYEFVIEE